MAVSGARYAYQQGIPMNKSFLLIMAILAFISGCVDLKGSKPILPIREYEKMIVGNLYADYVGTENCLAACH